MYFYSTPSNKNENRAQSFTKIDNMSCFDSVKDIKKPKIKTKAYINPNIINFETLKNSLGKNDLSKRNKIHFNPNFKKKGFENERGKSEPTTLKTNIHIPQVSQSNTKIINNIKHEPSSDLCKTKFNKCTSKYKVINSGLKITNVLSQPTCIQKTSENNYYSSIVSKFTKKGFKKNNTYYPNKNIVDYKNHYNFFAPNNNIKMHNCNNKVISNKSNPRFVSKTKIINLNLKKINNTSIDKPKVVYKPSNYSLSSKVLGNQFKYDFNKNKLIMKVASSIKNKYKYSRKVNNLKVSNYKLDKRIKKGQNIPPKSDTTSEISKLFPSSLKTKFFTLNRKSYIRRPYCLQKNSFSYRKPEVLKRLILRKSEQCPNKKIVKIGGILYKSTCNKLILAKDNKKPKLDKKNDEKLINKKIKKTHHIVYVRGEKFLLDKNGKTLVRQTSSEAKNKKSINFKRVDIGGVTYVQKSKNVLIKTNIHRARHIVSYAKNKSIATLCQLKKKSALPCAIYCKFGKCNRHSQNLCIYKHDPKNIAICRKYLKGNCSNKNCLLSHEVVQEKIATCLFFLNGNCNRDKCPFLHVKLNSNAEICEKFIHGFCDLGQSCTKRHLFLCPKYDKYGKCDSGTKCPYPHKLKETNNCKTSEKLSEEKLQYYTRKFELLPNTNEKKEKKSHSKLNVTEKKKKKCKRKRASTNIDSSVESMECVPKKIKLDRLPSFIPLKSNE